MPDPPARQVERFRDALLAHARARVGPGDRFDASDVVQQALLEAHRTLGQFRGGSDAEMAAWLSAYSTARSPTPAAATAAKRDAARERPVGDGSADHPPAGDPTPSAAAVRAEDADRLRAALEQLPPGQREAVEWRHLHGMPLAEIAERLGRSQTAAAGLLKRGLERLREIMREPP